MTAALIIAAELLLLAVIWEIGRRILARVVRRWRRRFDLGHLSDLDLRRAHHTQIDWSGLNRAPRTSKDHLP